MNPADKLQARLKKLGACGPAKEWAKGMSFKEAWEGCKCAPWLVWLALELNHQQMLSDCSYFRVDDAYCETPGNSHDYDCCNAIRAAIPFSTISRAMSKIEV